MSDLSNNNLGDEISCITIDDEFDRTKKYINPCGFDDATLRRRDNELKELTKLYPSTPPAMLEVAWNFHEFTPKEEQDRIIASKEFEGKPKQRMMGGIIRNAMSIESREIEVEN
tara:strand:- start:1727 stop:2068 length:342 start_codon:yes stop_codon:yes gene_type:complete